MNALPSTSCCDVEFCLDKHCLLVVDCQDSACLDGHEDRARLPLAQTTADCTDQCVVVACSDPRHAGVGDIMLNCSEPECPGYEDFLRCCTNYQSYDHVHENTPDSFGDSSNTDNSIEANPTQHLLAPLPQQSFHRCMWNGCPYSFLTREELIGHVNTRHLIPSEMTVSIEPTQPQASRFSREDLRNPTPYAVMPASSALSEKAPAEHLMPSSLVMGHGNEQSHLKNTSPAHQPKSAEGRRTSSLPLENADFQHYSQHTNVFDNHLQFPQRVTTKLDEEGFVMELKAIQHELGICEDLLAAQEAIKQLVGTSGNATSIGSKDRNVWDLMMSSKPSLASASAGSQSTDLPHSCAGIHYCKWQSCSEFFETCDSLTAHINAAHIGSGKARYDCLWQGCDRNGEKGLGSKQKITCTHLKQSHTGHRPFLCQICQQHFSEAATLQQHMRRHTNEKPYVCDFPGCNKAFAITGALTIHKRTHNGDKPFKCTFCDRAFAESSNLSKHLRTHTGSRPYICTEAGCDKAFARPDQLARHSKIHERSRRRTLDQVNGELDVGDQ